MFCETGSSSGKSQRHKNNEREDDFKFGRCAEMQTAASMLRPERMWPGHQTRHIPWPPMDV